METHLSSIKREKHILIVFLLCIFHLNSIAQYCSATGGCDEHISRVQFKTLDKNSGCTNYADYTSDTITVTAGSFYSIIVTNGAFYSEDSCDVWIDWNQDLDFDDTGEYYKLNSMVNPYTDIISVPIDALSGNTRMRIRIRYNGIMNPCGNANQNYGEVEDYCIKVYAATNMVINSILCSHPAQITVPGTLNQKIMLIKIIADGALNPKSLTNLYFKTTGTTNVADIDSAKIYYTGFDPVFSTMNPFGTAVYHPSGNFSINGTILLNADTNYIWLAYHVSTSAAPGRYLDALMDSAKISSTKYTPVNGNPAGNISIMSKMSGTYTINQQGSGNYASINAAISDLSNRGINGPVIFNINAGIYTEQINIPAINGSSSTNTILFRSTNSDTSTTRITYTSGSNNQNYVIRLFNAAYIKFQNLSIFAGNNFDYPRVIMIDGNSHHLEFLTNHIKGFSNSDSWNENQSLVFSPSNSPNNNILFNGNTFEYGSSGILFWWNDNVGESNLQINGNTFIDNTGTSIRTYGQTNMTISNNIINNQTGLMQFQGISTEYCAGPVTIEKNKLFARDITNGYGISVTNCSATNYNYKIQNNFISTTSNSGSYIRGITLNSDTSIAIYYNTILLDGNAMNCTGIQSWNVVNLNLKNNAIINRNDGYALSINNTTFSSNKNCYYSNGSNFAEFNEQQISTLASWIFQTTTDSLSIFHNPSFISESDLHTFDIALNTKALPITGITTDIDGDTRNVSTPDIGADEFTPPAIDVEVKGFYTGNISACGLSNNEKVKIIIKNAGTSNLSSGTITAKFQFLNSSQIVSETVNRAINSGDTIHYTFTTGANVSVNSIQKDSTFYIRCWGVLNGDPNHSNDTTHYAILSKYTPPAPTIAPISIPFASSTIITLPQIQGYIPFWYDSISNGNNFFIGNHAQTPLMYASDSAFVEYRPITQSDVMIGQESNTTSFPFGTSYQGNKTQLLYTRDELYSAGLLPGSITALAFNFSSYSSAVINGLTIKIKSTYNDQIYNLDTDTNNWTTVYSENYTIPGWNWQNIVFTNPYIWDGNSNILINICFLNTTTSSSSYVYCSMSYNKSVYGISYTEGCNISSASVQSYRPNIRFTGNKESGGCITARTKIKIIVTNIPAKDIGVIDWLSPNTGFELTSNEHLGLKIRNYGTQNIDTIRFYVRTSDTSSYVSEIRTGTIAPGATINYTCNTPLNLSAFQNYKIKAYLKVTGDTTYTNDTIEKEITNYTYCTPSHSGSCTYYHINGFQLNTLNNSNSACNSNPGSYIYYPENQATTFLQKGVTYPLTITPGGGSSQGYGIWIDYNHDGDFEDTDEFVFSTNFYSSNIIQGNISVPNTSGYLGKTRLRIRSVGWSYIYSNQYCSALGSGETEDYTITIAPPPLQKDVWLAEIIKPDTLIFLTIPTEVKVKVRNIGIDTATQIIFKYKVNQGSFVNYNWYGNLYPQQETSISLPNYTPLTSVNNLTVISSFSGDMNLQNDTLRKSFTAFPAPGIITITPDTIKATISSCDSTANTNKTLVIKNIGDQNLNLSIIQNKGLFDDFENGLDKWSFSGTWGTAGGYISSNALTESPVGNYPHYSNLTISLKDSLKIAMKDSCAVRYMLKRNMESCCDYLNTQISVNNGNWINLNQINGTEDWSLKEYSFSNYVTNGDYIKFRFNFTSDYSVNGDGILIDNFTIKGIEDGSSWLTYNPKSDTLKPDSSVIVNLNLKVANNNAGLHTQVLNIVSNDPIRPALPVPVLLTIIGSPQIVLRDSIKTFQPIMAGDVLSASFRIANTGCDTLKISSITKNSTVFVPQNPVFFIMPHDSGTLVVNFQPTIHGTYIDTLKINSNSTLKKIYVSGVALPAPKLVINPDSLTVSSSNCKDTIYRSLKIKNTGNTTLNWNASYSTGAGNALNFNGSTSYVDFGNLGNMPQKGTIEFWAKTKNPNFTYWLSSSGLNSTYRGITIYQSSSALYLIIGTDNGSSTQTYTLTYNIDTLSWHHIAFSWDKNTSTLNTYFDGAMYASWSSVTSWPTLIHDLQLGTGYDIYQNKFNGMMDEFRIWNVMRTPAEIQQSMYESWFTKNINITALWNFDEPSGDTIYNQNTSLYQGTMTNVSREVSSVPIFDPNIEVYPSNGALIVGDSTTAQVTFVTTGLNSGIYRSSIAINTNDPVNLQKTIPTKLTLSGQPTLQLSSTCFQADTIMAGASVTDTFYLSNTGCDTLKITSISHNNNIFTTTPYSLNILPGKTAWVNITFNPLNTGIYLDTLYFVSNAGNPKVCFRGVAIAAPLASVNPAFINAIITTCNQSTIKTFKLKNTGNATLNWSSAISSSSLFDSFNNGVDNSMWSSLTGGASASSCGSASGNNALYFNGSSTREATSKALSTIGGGNITFYLKIATGSYPCEQADYGEEVVLEYTTNNGASWSTIQTFGVGNYAYFTPLSIAIPSGAQAFNTKFRWRQLSHSGSGYDNWSIDEVSINTLNISTINPQSGIIAVNDSVTIQLTLNGNGLVNGIYQSNILINTNDPLHSLITVPCQLTVSASATIASSVNQLIMDTVMIGTPSIDSIYIKNTGCDTLKVNNITKNLPVFTLNPTVFTILPKDSGKVIINFSSLTVGNYLDTLKISSNAGSKNIPFRARANGAPGIITLPDIINSTLACDSQSTVPFKIKNPGIVALNWSATLGNQQPASLVFNGTGSYVSLGDWSPGTKWTVEAWVRPDNLPLGTKIIAGSPNTCDGWGLCLSDGKFAAIYRDAGSYCINFLKATTLTPVIGTWYHLAAVNDGATARFYINGQLIGSAPVWSGYSGFASAFIGGTNYDYYSYFSGAIDEVRIWNVARSQNQISTTKNHILNGNETSLIGYWRMYEQNGTILTDLSSGNHSGSIVGANWQNINSPTQSWINMSVTSGTINAGDSTSINLTLNRSLKPAGLNTYKLIINSDDPLKPFDTTTINITGNYNLNPVNLGNDTATCTGNSIALHPGTYTTYQWNNNSTASTLSVTTSGIYWIKVKDANGCAYNDTILVVFSQRPIADAGIDKSVCSGNTTTLNGSATGGAQPYQYSWKNTQGALLTNNSSYYFTPIQTQNFIFIVTDNNGCSSLPDTAKVSLFPSLTVIAKPDTTVTYGSIVQINTVVNGGTYPFNYNWSPIYNLSSSTIANPTFNANNQTNLIVNVTDANGCSASDVATINVMYSISGKVVYNNAVFSPIGNSKVILLRPNPFDSTTSSTSGIFYFPTIPGYSYEIYAKPTLSWSGVNATDALNVKRHIVGLSQLTGINVQAADVNGNGAVTSADALLILRRTVGLITSFNTGNWVSEKINLQLFNNVQNLTIKTICMGDVNASYSFGSKSTEIIPTLVFDNNKIEVIRGQELEIPIYYRQNQQTGALTLNTKYPDNLIDITNISTSEGSLEYNIENGELKIAWANENGYKLSTDEAFITIHAKVRDDATNRDIIFTIGNESELADKDGKVLHGAIFNTQCYQIVDELKEVLVQELIPNPAKESSSLKIYLPESRTINISIFNAFGEKISTIAETKQSKGWSKIPIETSSLSQGVYFLKINTSGKNGSSENIQRLMIIR